MGWIGHLPEARALSPSPPSLSVYVSLPEPSSVYPAETGRARRPETVDSGFDEALLSASCSQDQQDVDRDKVRLYFLLSKGEKTKGLHLCCCCCCCSCEQQATSSPWSWYQISPRSMSLINLLTLLSHLIQLKTIQCKGRAVNNQSMWFDLCCGCRAATPLWLCSELVLVDVL